MSGTEVELDIDDLLLSESVTTELQPALPVVSAAAVGVRVESTCPTIFDIETGPRPWSEIEQFYDLPAALPPWSDDMVKYGTLKDKDKREQKRLAAKADYEARLASQADDAAIHRGAWLDGCALDPILCRVLAIGYLRGDEVVIDHGDETRLLEQFWGRYDSAVQHTAPMIGFNIFGFDLPFIMRRSWYHKINTPAGILRDSRYWSRIFFDLMVDWNCGQKGFIKLDRLAQFFGTARKSGSGADFARLYVEDQAAAIQYLAQDLRVTAEVARRMGVI